MLGYREVKEKFVRHLVLKAKEEIKLLEEEVMRLEKLVVGSVKKASSVALEIAKNAEPSDPPHTIYNIAAKAKTKNNGVIARKPKKRKYVKRSKYWKK